MISKKKALLGTVMAACLTLLAVPAFAADGNVSTEDELKAALADPSIATITLAQDITLDAPLSIERAVTIDGTANKYAITYNKDDAAIVITSEEAVELKNLEINETASNETTSFAIDLSSKQPNLTVTDSVINTKIQGIHMYPDGGCTGGKLTVTGTDIINTAVADPDNEAVYDLDARGIATSKVKDSAINISNSNIKGFKYCVNLGGTVGGSTYTVTDSTISGWAAFNVWSVKNTFNITNSHLIGINRKTSDWDNFATFVINPDIYGGNKANANKVNISGGSVRAYAYDTALQTNFLESSECFTLFSFSTYNGSPVYLMHPKDVNAFEASSPADNSQIQITGKENFVEYAM